MAEVSNAKEHLEETVSTLNERKVASKALAEVDKRVLQATNGDKAHWKLLTKVYANKGKAWAGESPLVIDKEELDYLKLVECISIAVKMGFFSSEQR